MKGFLPSPVCSLAGACGKARPLSGKPRQSKAIRVRVLADWARQGPATPDTALAGSPGNQRQRPCASGKKPSPRLYTGGRQGWQDAAAEGNDMQ
jgi:hypothetical protein